ARGSDPDTGDGAGILMQIPDDYYRAVVDFDLPPPGAYATGLVFLPTTATDEARAATVLEKYARQGGADILGWREVAIQPRGLGASAAAARPRIMQVFLASDDA